MRYTPEQLRAGFLLTLRLAIEGRTMPYGDFAQELRLVRKSNHSMGVVADVLDSVYRHCKDKGIEPTNSLVINTTHSMPGNGFYRILNEHF